MFPTRRYIQADVKILADDGYLNFMKRLKKKDIPSKKYWDVVSRYVKKAILIVINQTKSNIQTMNAVATGFMRNNIVSTVNIQSGKTPIVAVIGTKAWYDILVHEGLGRHSPGNVMPKKYLPTPAQKAIIPAFGEAKKYWKKSPKIPRPFLMFAIQSTKVAVAKMIAQGCREANKATGIKRGSLKEVTKGVLNSYKG
jgi:hypothetical protein